MCMGVGKGAGGAWTPLDFAISYFPITFLGEKIVILVSSG